MGGGRASRSAGIRAKLTHPVVDADGHYIEVTPVLLDYIRQVGGSGAVERYLQYFKSRDWITTSPDARRSSGLYAMPWWTYPSVNVVDRATASLPRLLNERLHEMGLDFTILYPSEGLMAITLPGMEDDELRRVACRSLNTYQAEVFHDYPERMTPAAVIPMHTPQEAIEELEHSVDVLGAKAIIIAGDVQRPLRQGEHPHPATSASPQYSDTFGIDSDYDYDPVWAKCVELKVAPTSHSGTMGLGTRQSISRAMYNHIGHFGAAGEALCKALFFGGVTRRFPGLKFAFLEGGVGWACTLYADMIAHWEKRNANAIQHFDPTKLDWVHAEQLLTEYGDEATLLKMDRIRELWTQPRSAPPELDDWSQCDIEEAKDIRDLFIPNFFFGCEADDPINSWAFNTKVNPFGARINAMLGSDIGHWDVTDMSTVIEEAYALVERELLDEADFESLVFSNAVRLHAGMNPDFFTGTVVEADAARALAGP